MGKADPVRIVGEKWLFKCLESARFFDTESERWDVYRARYRDPLTQSSMFTVRKSLGQDVPELLHLRCYLQLGSVNAQRPAGFSIKRS